MRTNRLFPWIIPMIALAFSSCVSQKKYLAEVSEKQTAMQRQKECLQREEDLKAQIEALNRQIEAYGTRIAYKDGQIESLNQENERINKRNQELQADLNRIINDATSEQERLGLALKTKADDLALKEKLVNELQAAIAQRDSAMAAILGRIENALKQYQADELSVELRDGKVYIALSDKLLFQSGSFQIDKRGKEALGKLAGALSKNPDISIMVEGHTDNVPIKTSAIRDNWDLSVLRATTVVDILTGEYGLTPQQLTAAGRAEFVPKSPNDTKEGRALNRRTEIIIQPRLEEIYGVLKGSAQKK